MDARTRENLEEADNRARIAVGFAVATVVTALPTGAIATVAVVFA